ncbi:hypothetical protein SO802_032716 [Lithocarpus litseifolius]|uniref:hAT-like transposase RNase-H fold domain-containing protein n=1 Tax=Lithocarpus litseifolius TaxID=425828 RepID=A0AAW2BB12_9ROSI
MISTVAESMLAKFNSYWANVDVVKAVAAILYPRYKMKLLEFYYPNNYGDNSDLEIEKIKNLCYDLIDKYGDVDESPVDNEGSSHMPTRSSTIPRDCTLQSILDDGEPNEEDESCVTVVDD